MTSQTFVTNKALKHAIVDDGRTQRMIARRARIDETRLSRIISGQIEATAREVKSLARVLNVEPDELFPVPDLPNQQPAVNQ